MKIISQISYQQLPLLAKKLIPKKTKSFIDEIEFYLLKNNEILATYGDEFVAIFNEKIGWRTL